MTGRGRLESPIRPAMLLATPAILLKNPAPHIAAPRDVYASMSLSLGFPVMPKLRRRSGQDRSAIYHQDLASAESFLHQKHIGLRYVMRFADPPHRQTLAHALIHLLPLRCTHALPEVRPNDPGRHRVDAYRRELHSKGACQGVDSPAYTRGNNPSFLRALPGDSGGEHDRAALANILASVFNRRQCSPITQLKGASGLFEICSGKVVQMEAIASGENQVVESTELRKESFDGLFVREVKRVPLRVSAQRFNGFLNSFRVA